MKTCAFCKRKMAERNVVKSPHSERYYCIDRLAVDCNRQFGANVPRLQTQGWKFVPVG